MLINLYPCRTIAIIRRIAERHLEVAYHMCGWFDKKQVLIDQTLNFTETVFISGKAGKIPTALLGLI